MEKAVYLLWGGLLPVLRVFTGLSSGTCIASQMSIYPPRGGLLLGQVGAESRQPFCRETDGRKSPRPAVPVSAWQGF